MTILVSFYKTAFGNWTYEDNMIWVDTLKKKWMLNNKKMFKVFYYYINDFCK